MSSPTPASDDRRARGRTQQPARGRDARVHRALANPVRARLLAALRASDGPLGIDDLRERSGLHANTVRSHLAVLEDAELVVAEPLRSTGRGRPPLGYRATTGAAEVGEGDGYRSLARVLASHLASSTPDPGATARAIGATWGRSLVEEPGPGETVAPAAAIDQLVAMLTEVGFEPATDDEVADTDTDVDDGAAGVAPAMDVEVRVDLHRCPFLDVAREHQEVVCNIHLGMMRGAMDALGGEVVVRDLLPFVSPGRCVSHLEVER